MVRYVGIHEKGEFSLRDLLKSVKNRPDFHKTGALATFIGVVRGETRNGETVKKLILEAYEEKANEVLDNICKELKKREDVIDVQIHHLVGEFIAGEDLVYVVVAGAHRQNVFPVLKEAVERYKKEATIFKKEYTIDKTGALKSHWISENKTKQSREKNDSSI
ncbi:MAG: molybdenum cofactor biosynthesis protein MoaE [Candidatus Bathyarchaeota archaeon]|nr:MAG: molybdenum cofactor biosynthesis protein MoaE [Candidatus Bathyarchaeota archaeon]